MNLTEYNKALDDTARLIAEMDSGILTGDMTIDKVADHFGVDSGYILDVIELEKQWRDIQRRVEKYKAEQAEGGERKKPKVSTVVKHAVRVTQSESYL